MNVAVVVSWRDVWSKSTQSSESPCSGSVVGQKADTHSTIGMMFS